MQNARSEIRMALLPLITPSVSLGQLFHALPGSHHNGSVSTASAALSIASWAGFPTTGTMDVTAPPTRIGTVATLVKRHPDSPNNSSRSVSHLIIHHNLLRAVAP